MLAFSIACNRESGAAIARNESGAAIEKPALPSLTIRAIHCEPLDGGHVKFDVLFVEINSPISVVSFPKEHLFGTSCEATAMELTNNLKGKTITGEDESPDGRALRLVGDYMARGDAICLVTGYRQSCRRAIAGTRHSNGLVSLEKPGAVESAPEGIRSDHVTEQARMNYMTTHMAQPKEDVFKWGHDDEVNENRVYSRLTAFNNEVRKKAAAKDTPSKNEGEAPSQPNPVARMAPKVTIVQVNADSSKKFSFSIRAPGASRWSLVADAKWPIRDGMGENADFEYEFTNVGKRRIELKVFDDKGTELLPAADAQDLTVCAAKC